MTEPRDAGPAAARNAGVARRRATIVVFVDADIEVHPDALRRLREVLERDPGLDAVFGGYDDRPAVMTAPCRAFATSFTTTSTRARPVRRRRSGPGSARSAARPSTPSAASTRSATRVPSIEDIELGMRLHAAGHRIVLEPAVRGTHLKRWTLGSMLRTDLAARGAPWVALRLERGGAGGGALNLSWRQRLAALAAVAAAGQSR